MAWRKCAYMRGCQTDRRTDRQTTYYSPSELGTSFLRPTRTYLLTSTIMQLYCTTSNITQQEIQYRWKSRSLEHTQDTVPTPHRAQLAARTPFHIRSRAASIYISTARSPRVHGCFNSRRICTCHGTCIQFTSITPLAPTFEWIVFVQKGPSDDSSVMVIARPSTTRVPGRDFWPMLKL